MKQLVRLFSLLIMSVLVLTSCNYVKVSAGQEAVLIDKPVFFGHGGVRPTTVTTGTKIVWASCDDILFDVRPVKHDIVLDDIFSNDNTPLDFHTQITTQIKKGKANVLLENYGEQWFDIIIRTHYVNLVTEYVSDYSPFDLMSNTKVLKEVDAKVKKDMDNYVAKLNKDAEFPIIIKDVQVGKAKPNSEQLQEMNRTAKVIQAKQTQEREFEVQVAREKAERQKAKADKAYMLEMNLNPNQYINLKWVETVANKQGANIDVMVGPATSMWNVK